MPTDEAIIGIDLGTTNSVVAVIEGEQPQIIPNAEGNTKTPSTVAFLDGGNVLVGEIARRQMAIKPERTISSAKRLLGRLGEELEEEQEIYPFQIGEDEEGLATIVIDDQAYPPEHISAIILKKLKKSAETFLNKEVNRAVITVPAYFDDIQRHATLKAAEEAGLEVLRLINEPTAAAMAYGLARDCQEVVGIYDFGGGTFDFSVLEIDDKTFEVLLSTGNSRLGGDDLDMCLVDHFADKFLGDNGIDLRDNFLTLRRLKDEMERVKCELSSATSALVSLPFIAYKDGDPLHLETPLTRDEFEDIVEPFIQETLNCCRLGLRDAGLRKSHVSKIILVGGTTRIPLVQELVEDFFSMVPYKGINPDEAVAVGAAVQAAAMTGDLDEVILLDVTPHTLSIEVTGDRTSPLIEKNSTIPIKVAREFTTSQEGQTFVNVHLLQGEENKASENRSLGKFTLTGIEEVPAGEPRIRVEIFVNADGVVELTATDTQSEQEMKLSSSFSHLDAEERRRRRGLREERPARRRKKSATGTNKQTDKAEELAAPIEPAPAAPEPAKAEQAPVEEMVRDLAASAPGTNPGGTSDCDERASTQIRPRTPISKADKKGAQGKKKVAKPKKKAVKKVARKISAPKVDDESDREVAPSNGAGIQSEATGRPAAQPQEHAEVSAEHRAEETLHDDTRIVGQLVAEGLGILTDDVPGSLDTIIEFVCANRSDIEACTVYNRLGNQFSAFCNSHTETQGVEALKAWFLIVSKQPEEARRAIAGACSNWPDSERENLALYSLLCESYPNYQAARRERADLALKQNDFKVAIEDLEFIAKGETSDTGIYSELSGLYSKVLEDGGDATVQFKLVKIMLRRGELDQAIAQLQQLIQVPRFQERAEKVLGLCFWQKGLRYLALQKFKALELTEEVKDLLYRLAADMEENGEHLHATYALERIYAEDIGYRDTAEKLRKIGQQVDLKNESNFGHSPDTPISQAGTNRTSNDSVIGGRFEIIHEINRGSMGVVYKARDVSLDEVVAIKVLNEFLGSDAQAVERFKNEARSSRRLTHAHIVRVHDFFDMGEKKLISMEYIEGEDMKTILARNQTFTEDLVLTYLAQICEAMAYAHRLGIVHRDIKPANIMIDERNQVKVTDFGIAKVLDRAASNNSTMIMGTPLYMSPEQIQGGDIDERVDIYALGIMLYELVTGTPPFVEGNVEYQHIHSPIPEITVGISEQLRDVILKCVEKDVKKRYRSVDAMCADLPWGVPFIRGH